MKLQFRWSGRKGFHKDVFEIGAKLGLENALVDGQRTPISHQRHR